MDRKEFDSIVDLNLTNSLYTKESHRMFFDDLFYFIDGVSNCNATEYDTDLNFFLKKPSKMNYNYFYFKHKNLFVQTRIFLRIDDIKHSHTSIFLNSENDFKPYNLLNKRFTPGKHKNLKLELGKHIKQKMLNLLSEYEKMKEDMIKSIDSDDRFYSLLEKQKELTYLKNNPNEDYAIELSKIIPEYIDNNTLLILSNYVNYDYNFLKKLHTLVRNKQKTTLSVEIIEHAKSMIVIKKIHGN